MRLTCQSALETGIRGISVFQRDGVSERAGFGGCDNSFRRSHVDVGVGGKGRKGDHQI